MISEATKIARSKAYEDLTPEELAIVSNGCGAKIGLKAPNLIFRDCCDRHDYDYARGGCEADRDKADEDFLTNMLIKARRNPFYRIVAYLYHFAVSFLKHNPCFAYESTNKSSSSSGEKDIR